MDNNETILEILQTIKDAIDKIYDLGKNTGFESGYRKGYEQANDDREVAPEDEHPEQFNK